MTGPTKSAQTNSEAVTATRFVQSLLILLLIAAAIPSCKSPTAIPQSSAFTLFLPDSTVAWGDSAMMRVVPAKSVRPRPRSGPRRCKI